MSLFVSSVGSERHLVFLSSTINGIAVLDSVERMDSQPVLESMSESTMVGLFEQ
jgi:hypothetical protein